MDEDPKPSNNLVPERAGPPRLCAHCRHLGGKDHYYNGRCHRTDCRCPRYVSDRDEEGQARLV